MALADPHSLPRSPPHGTGFGAPEPALRRAGLHSTAGGPQSLPLTAGLSADHLHHFTLPTVFMEYTLIAQDDRDDLSVSREWF
jgi:hypothetical protein